MGSVHVHEFVSLDGVIDEPTWTRGDGPRLFADGAPPVKLSLARCESYDNGVTYMNLRSLR